MSPGVSHWTIVLATAIFSVAAIAKAWISLRRTKLLENGRNNRFHAAIANADPGQRPAIIGALNGEKPDEEEPDSDDSPADTSERRSIPGWLQHLWRYLWPPKGGP
ncbi:hypothetical protein [Kibdelosporangium phytohabitans]|uniref:Uncharacterized protein n=1 Tax=Kibdelosporangium phytohabitans TaxID=860235 RepID=A0A0N7F537_9PSEU|nr:hypothetical protein [Kibdelosporangium phytohabitans]ALG13143.1 hypothetical protein AOZ06_45415 [Kibdelosporangium phytohabitans]MBE1464894.1 hypothetical protein [Kibdelosporangium phytohabitans]